MSDSAPSSSSSSNANGSSWREPCEIGMVVPCDGIVTNLEFHDDGKFLAVTTNQNAIHLVDCLNGVEKKKIFVKKDGVGKVQYSHHEMSLLMTCHPTSGVPCHDIKYLCLYDNRYLRYFKGHTMDVTSLSMCPVSDQFVSAAFDGTCRLWDINTPNCIGKINLPFSCGPFYPPGSTSPYYQQPLVSYDSTGLVFGVLHHGALKLYDCRNYDAGPFANIFPQPSVIKQAMLNSNDSLTDAQISRFMNALWVNFEFSPDAGSSVLINTNSEALLLLDGINAENEPKVITSRKNDSGQALGATFSADAKYVITGNDENDILYYDRNTLELQRTLSGHVAPVGRIRSNKVYDTIASGCVNAVLWIQKQP